MNKNKRFTTEELLIMILGNIIKRDLGGTTEAAERLALKLIFIMDN